MNREDLTYWIKDGASILGQSGNTMHADFVREAADLLDQQAKQIAELEAEREAAWIAGRDAAAAIIDCGCTYREQAIAGIKLGWDKDCQQGECFALLAAEIRSLTPPEDKP
jgi:hypothetical protein